MAKIFSGIQPSGDLHLGNLLGALQNWVANQDTHEAVYCVVDLHALTDSAPASSNANSSASLSADAHLSKKTLDITQLLLAVGIDPKKCILFAQSHVVEHAQLAWLLQCNVSFGELKRMTQFKDKSDRADFISAGLFTYPALQAADILLYNTEIVPVGDDQRQHIELTRDIAERFNSRYGQTFVVPKHHIPESGARVMDLQDPTKKMSKSEADSAGCILIMDDPKTIEKKVKRAVTDSEPEVRYDPANKPGVSNLLEIMSGLMGGSPTELAKKYNNHAELKKYGELKKDCAELIISTLAPIQESYVEISKDTEQARAVLAEGATKARAIAGPVLERAYKNIGLLA